MEHIGKPTDRKIGICVIEVESGTENISYANKKKKTCGTNIRIEYQMLPYLFSLVVIFIL
jgi:hypothetical protein